MCCCINYLKRYNVRLFNAELLQGGSKKEQFDAFLQYLRKIINTTIALPALLYLTEARATSFMIITVFPSR